MCNFLLPLRDTQACYLYSLAELVPLIVLVTNLAASYWTLSRCVESQSQKLFPVTSPYSITGLIRLLYKDVKMKRSTLYVTNSNMFNRLVAFSYTWTLWFLQDILNCKVKPKWSEYETQHLWRHWRWQKKKRANHFITLQRKYITRFKRIHSYR